MSEAKAPAKSRMPRDEQAAASGRMTLSYIDAPRVRLLNLHSRDAGTRPVHPLRATLCRWE